MSQQEDEPTVVYRLEHPRLPFTTFMVGGRLSLGDSGAGMEECSVRDICLRGWKVNKAKTR